MKKLNNMIKEQLVSFETAKLAREKGFKSKSRYYDGSGELVISPDIPENDYRHSNNIMQRFRYESPTQSLLQKWLREEHKIYVSPIRDLPLPHNSWKCELEYISPAKTKHIVKTDVHPICYKGVYEGGTYEEAFEAGLYDALKLIK